MKKIKLLVALLAIVLVIGCEKPSSDQSQWIVKVNKDAITSAELETGILNLSTDLQKQFPNQQDQIKFVLNQLVQNEMFYQEAIELGLDSNEDYVNFITRLDNQYNYQKKQGLVQLFLKEKVDSSIQVSDGEIEDIYNKNKDVNFSNFEQRSLSAILVKTQDEANSVVKQLKKGADFATLAKTNSIDVSSAQNGGKLPNYYRAYPNGLNQEFSDKIFKLSKAGQYTTPIQTEVGFYIFKVDDIQQVNARSLDEVKNFIANQIYLSKRNEQIGIIRNNIKEKYTIVENEELIKADDSAAEDAKSAPEQTDKTNG